MRSLTQIRRLFRAAILLSILAAIALQTVSAQVRVRGYYRKDGTYVRPHVRTYPDGNPYNNYSFPGNYNPNTGQITPGNPETYLSRYYGRGATTRTLPSSGSRAGVVALQQALRLLGHDPGAIDGIYGPASSAAVRSFQEKTSLPETGDLSTETIDRLIVALRQLDSGASTLLFLESPGNASVTLPPTPDLSGLSSDERSSIKSVCASEKLFQGPAAYNRCVASQLSSLNNAPRTPDLSGLSRDERSSIKSVCASEKLFQGPAAYNRCVASQLSTLNNAPRTPDLSGLSRDERSSIKSVCASEKLFQGPAAYNRCVASQLSTLNNAPRTPDLSGLSRDERSSIKSVCASEKLFQGPAAYNRCVASQLSTLNNAPRTPDLSGLSRDERSSIKSVCASEKLFQGPAAYNRCVASQLSSLN